MGREDGGDCAVAGQRLFGSKEEEVMKVKASGGSSPPSSSAAGSFCAYSRLIGATDEVEDGGWIYMSTSIDHLEHVTHQFR